MMMRCLVGVVVAMTMGACDSSGTEGGQDGGQADGAQSDGNAFGDGAAVQQQDGGGGQHDGAGGQQDGGATCIPAATPGNGGHNAGDACLGCHASMSGGRKFTLAGTVYASAAGGTAVGGATVRVTPASGSPFDIVTGANGNFYTTQAVTFPATVLVSKCPDSTPMVATISSGDCNSSGCHASGSRVHLP